MEDATAVEVKTHNNVLKSRDRLDKQRVPWVWINDPLKQEKENKTGYVFSISSLLGRSQEAPCQACSRN